MEHRHPTSFPESLKATLNCYKITSIDSLSGPSGYPALAAQMWFKENKQLPPIPPQPMVQIPYFIPNDKSAKRSDTMLAGEKIACFIVGGEKRLCLPQILTSVLQEYSIAVINQACAELHIYCSRCLPDQLEILKALGILPINTAQCGLITKTDAERLVALLTDQHEPVKNDRLPKEIDPESGIPVYHECFGRAYGTFYPAAYISPVAKCIMCKDCHCVYSPQRFIAHSDRSFEKRTCHWGFDPENWRNYLLLPKDLEGPKREEFQKVLDEVKALFNQPRYEAAPPSIRYTGSPPTPSKRRYDSEQESPSRKKLKEEDGKVFEQGMFPHPYASLPYGVPSIMRHSAFRPWSPGLSTIAGPNPGDVISDLAHMKGLVPFSVDRRGAFPQYIQTSRPVVLGSRASEFTLPQPAEGRAASSAHPISASERKKSTERSESSIQSPRSPLPREAEREKDKNNNHEQILPHSSSMLKVDLTRSRSFEKHPAERQRNRSVSPPRPSNVAEVSPRAHGRVSPKRYPTLAIQSTNTESSNNNHTLKEPETEISRPVSRSREAAATAMLELKSSGLYRSGPPPLITCPITPPASSTNVSESPRKLPPTPNTPKTASTIIALDRHYYKWMIGGQSYIISAAGVQSLETLRCLVEAKCGSEAWRGRLMHELVKMKFLHEEKMAIEMKVRHDLKSELEDLKTNNREKLHQMAESRKALRQEIERMRQEYARRLEDSEKRTKSEGSRQGGSKDSGEQSALEKELKELRSRIHELQMKNGKLQVDLIDEKDKRQEAESKLEKAENSRGRLPESSLSRMVRGVSSIGRRTAADEDKPPLSLRPPVSPISKKTSSTQVPITSTSTMASVSHCQLNGVLPTATATNGLPHEQLLAGDMEAPKTVVVS